MAFVVKDRIKVTAAAPAQGTVTLGSAELGYQTFAAIGDGNSTYYAIQDLTNNLWEVGEGTYTHSGTTLSRDSVLSNSAGTTNKINFANTVEVFVTTPATKSVHMNLTDDLEINGDATFTSDNATDQILIKNTNTGADAAPDLVLWRDSSSPANADSVGRIDFRGEDDGSTARNYTSIESKIVNVAASTPTGAIHFKTLNASTSEADVLVLSGNAATFSGVVTANAGVVVDNITIDGNDISTTNSNGNLTITPNGTGDLYVNSDRLAVKAANDEAATVLLGADNQDDAGDTWKITAQADHVLVLQNDKSGSSDVTHFSITPHATVTSSTVAIAGGATVGATLGVTGVVTANAGVVVDNITIDGNEIDVSSGDLTLDVAGDIILDSDAPNWRFKDNGTSILEIGSVSSGASFYNAVSNADMYFKGNDGGSPVTALTLDMGDAGKALFNSGLSITSTDMPNVTAASIYHDSSNRLRFTGGTAGYLFCDDTNGTGQVSIDASGVMAITGDLSIDSGTNAKVTINDAISEVGTGNIAFQAVNSAGSALKPMGFRAEEFIFIGNVGIGATPVTWNSGNTALQIGGNGILHGSTAAGAGKFVALTQNAHIDSDGSWEYISTDEASNYYQDGGAHYFRTAASGTAGNDITWTNVFTIDASGNIDATGALNFSTNNHQITGQNAYNVHIKTGSTNDYSGLYITNADSDSANGIQLYSDANAYGFLQSVWGSWDFKKIRNGNLYFNNSTTYYLNPNSTSKIDTLYPTGYISFDYSGNNNCTIHEYSNDTTIRSHDDLILKSRWIRCFGGPGALNSLSGETEYARISDSGNWFTGPMAMGGSSTAYGSSGQVLTSNGNASPSWQTAGGGAWEVVSEANFSNVTSLTFSVATDYIYKIMLMEPYISSSASSWISSFRMSVKFWTGSAYLYQRTVRWRQYNGTTFGVSSTTSTQQGDLTYNNTVWRNNQSNYKSMNLDIYYHQGTGNSSGSNYASYQSKAWGGAWNGAQPDIQWGTGYDTGGSNTVTQIVFINNGSSTSDYHFAGRYKVMRIAAG